MKHICKNWKFAKELLRTTSCREQVAAGLKGDVGNAPASLFFVGFGGRLVRVQLLRELLQVALELIAFSLSG
jgi:hypothetical protein